MWRVTAVLLVVINLVLLAWGQGWLAAYRWGPHHQREPDRLLRQVRPDALMVIDEARLQALLAAEQAESPAQCLQSDWLEPAQAERVRALLGRTWPEGSWQLDSRDRDARWLVYMGRYTDADDLARKRLQLRHLKVRYELLRNSALAPGLALGRFATQAEAEAALQRLRGQGVRSARVQAAASEPEAYRLRLPTVNAALQTHLQAVQAQLPELTLCESEATKP